MLGDTLEQCREALITEKGDSLHLIERINIDLQVSNSIVPSALNLARMKVSGKLPTLQVNFSETKYKTLMRLIDVCVPKFDDDQESEQRPPLRPVQAVSGSNAFRLRSGLFGGADEYHVEEDEPEAEKKVETRTGKHSESRYWKEEVSLISHESFVHSLTDL